MLQKKIYIPTINKIQDTPDALYIYVSFKNAVTAITIDTGTNVCCVREQLLGQDHLTIIKNNNKFLINANVIRNLSSAIILGNDFLIKLNACINFKEKMLTIDNLIKIKLNIREH